MIQVFCGGDANATRIISGNPALKMICMILIKQLQCSNYTPLVIVLHVDSQAGVGWLSWSVAKSLRAFVESVFANSRVKNVVFTIQGKQAIYSCQYTGAVIG